MEEIRIVIKNVFERAHGKITNILEDKMTMHWVWIIIIWISSWLVLLSMAQIFHIITWTGIGLLAIHVTNWIHQAIQKARPKKLIHHTQNKSVLITGCDTGFGHELAVRLDDMGFKVFAGCLFPEGDGAKQLDQETSDRLQILHIDVTEDTTINEAFRIVKQQLETSKDILWALVNNAGIATVTEIEWCPLEVYQRIFNVNALGLIRITKKFLPLIRRNEGNRIIIVASLAGRYTFPGFTAYSMSKHAAVSFADGLRLEMRKWKVSVHTVEPTLYKTPISQESIFQKNVDTHWEQCPDDVKKSYGNEYLQDFKAVVSNHLKNAKPLEKIHEVVDDMVDAVAGEEPKVRYVPSIQTQLRAHFLSILPKDVLDNLLSKATPQTPPADLEGMKRPHFHF